MTVAADDSIRADTSPDSLAKLKPYFKKGGTVTVGNACSVSAARTCSCWRRLALAAAVPRTAEAPSPPLHHFLRLPHNRTRTARPPW